jgi:hypothetical protein
MPERPSDSRALFYEYYNKYETARHFKIRNLTLLFAILSVKEIETIAGASDIGTCAKTVNQLFEGVFSEKQALELYKALSKNSIPRATDFLSAN